MTVIMQTKSINLFEYSNLEMFQGDISSLEDYLDVIWKSRTTALSGEDEEALAEQLTSHQRFLVIGRDGMLKSQKYVGIIRFNNTIINLLPKIFYDKDSEAFSGYSDAIQANVLWWLSYCRKFKFPKSMMSLNTLKANFFEVLIYLFAQYTKEALNKTIVRNYEEVSSELNYVKGRINIPAYIKENLVAGNWHKVACTYDSFEIDNTLNRIIKSVANLLRGTTSNYENRSLLSEILFMLEDVSDCRMTIHDCSKVKINPFYDDINVVLDYCKLFLSNSVSFTYKNELRVYAFLLPMEYIFEDFIYGFMDAHLRKVDGVGKLLSQKRDLYLARLYKGDKLIDNNVFNMQQDIYLEFRNKKMILDTKYKIIYQNAMGLEVDNKCGVSQGDLYQMVSYAIRRKADSLLLVYPMSLRQQLMGTDANVEPTRFVITDEYSNRDINIDIMSVPVIHHNFPNISRNHRLHETFSATEEKLFRTLVSRLKMM